MSRITRQLGTVYYTIDCPDEHMWFAERLLLMAYRRLASHPFRMDLSKTCTILLPFGTTSVRSFVSRPDMSIATYHLGVSLPAGAFTLEDTSSLQVFLRQTLGWSPQVQIYSSQTECFLLCEDEHRWGIPSNAYTILSAGLSEGDTQGLLFIEYLLSYLDACHLLLEKFFSRDERVSYVSL